MPSALGHLDTINDVIPCSKRCLEVQPLHHTPGVQTWRVVRAQERELFGQWNCNGLPIPVRHLNGMRHVFGYMHGVRDIDRSPIRVLLGEVTFGACIVEVPLRFEAVTRCAGIQRIGLNVPLTIWSGSYVHVITFVCPCAMS